MTVLLSIRQARLTGISKLDDANEAGGRNGYKCTLIITEGDSAKALAVAGLSVIGRDYYGVFPLRGKLLNVRDASHSTIMNNKEVSELKQIIGLQQGKSYEDEASVKSLRYGKLMIMTDQVRMSTNPHVRISRRPGPRLVVGRCSDPLGQAHCALSRRIARLPHLGP